MPPSPFRRRAAASSLVILLVALAGCQVSTLPPPPPPPQAVPLPPTAPPVQAPPPAAAPARPSDLVDVGGKTDIALLLPLTGSNAGLGNDMLDAAQLALVEVGSDEMALTPKDTHGTADGAAAAARRAVAEGARLIVGPLTANEVEAVRPIAAEAGINVIAFSNQARVAGNGVFVLGFRPEEETQRLARYARSAGVERFAVLAPDNPYGRLAGESFRNAVEQAGGAIDDLEYYQPGQDSPHAAIEALAHGGKPGFTALLLPEGVPDRLKTIASQLPLAGISTSDVRLLGTDTLDLPGMGTEPSLVGAWYAAPPPDARTGFESRFAKAYGHKPLRLATLAYDAVGIAAVVGRTPHADFSVTALTSPSGFAGADGVFRLTQDGTAQRGLAVLQVEHDGSSVVSPAPESFEQVAQ